MSIALPAVYIKTDAHRPRLLEGIWPRTQHLGTSSTPVSCIDLGETPAYSHRDHATALLSKYWSTRNTKPTKAVPAPSNKRGRPSKGKAPAHQPPAKMAKTTNTRTKRAAPRRAYDGPANTDDTYQDDLSKYLDVEDWEDLVQSIDTMERGPDGTLLVFMTM